MAQEQPSLQEKKAGGFFTSLRLKKKDHADDKDDDHSAKSPARSPRTKHVDPAPATINKNKSSSVVGAASVPVKKGPSSASLSKGTTKAPVFVPDSKQSAEVNAIRKRAWEEEQRLNAAIASEFVYNPALSEDENVKNQLRWEGEQKLLAAMNKLHHDKEMVARAYPQGDQAVSSYAARFMKRSAKRKAKNPNLSSELGPSTAVSEEAAAAATGSTTLKPGRKQNDSVAKQYLAQYAAMTPQAALKKRLLMSEAEREINEKSKADSYLNRFLEDKVDAAPKRGAHVRRSSDSFSIDPPVPPPTVEAKPKSETGSPLVKESSLRESLRLQQQTRRRSTTSSGLSRSASSATIISENKMERKATMERVLEMEQQKLQQMKNAPLDRVSGSVQSVESSDVEESSSTFESDDDDDSDATTTTTSAKSAASAKNQKGANGKRTKRDVFVVSQKLSLSHEESKEEGFSLCQEEIGLVGAAATVFPESSGEKGRGRSSSSCSCGVARKGRSVGHVQEPPSDGGGAAKAAQARHRAGKSNLECFFVFFV